MVIWIIGLSAAGKTTLASNMFRILKRRRDDVVLVDGDLIRSITGHDLDHSVEGRRKNAERIKRLCAALHEQGQLVICAILSIFPESSEWNREHIDDYREIYLEVSPETVRRRDFKGLYAKADAGEMPNVVGEDIPFPVPEHPDLVINNDADNADMEAMARETLGSLGLWEPRYAYTETSLRLHPFKYEYTEFQGPSFFRAFAEDRDLALARLRAKADRLDTLEPVPASPHPLAGHLDLRPGDEASLWKLLPLKDAIPSGNIDTAGWFVGAFDELRQGALPPGVETLVRRFEVSKKIRTVYGPDFRKVSEDDEPVLYALFGVLMAGCCRVADGPHRLIFLNALLKANDILASEWGALVLPAEVRGAIRSLVLEQCLVDEMTGEVLP